MEVDLIFYFQIIIFLMYLIQNRIHSYLENKLYYVLVTKKFIIFYSKKITQRIYKSCILQINTYSHEKSNRCMYIHFYNHWLF